MVKWAAIPDGSLEMMTKNSKEPCTARTMEPVYNGYEGLMGLLSKLTACSRALFMGTNSQKC